MLELAGRALFQQMAQGMRQVGVAVVGHRHIGRQVDLRRLLAGLLEAEQRGFLAARQHVGAAPYLTGHEVPGRCLAVRLLGGARVQAQVPGQAPLRRQALAHFQLAAFDRPRNRLDQFEVAGQGGVA